MSETKNIIVHGDSRNYIPKIRTPIDCVITDPPFGIDVQMNSAVLPTSRAVNKKIENDSSPQVAIDTFYGVMGPILAKLNQQADIYVFTAWNVLDWWIPAVKRLSHLREDGTLRAPWEEQIWDIELKMMLIWDKGYPGKGDLQANWGCGYEPILYLKKGRRLNPYRRSGIIHVDKVPAGQNIHPTEKPVQLLEILAEMSTVEGDFIVDPFSGSGSTSVAAKRLGRNSLAFEIDEQWIAPSQARLEQLGLF